MLRKQPLGSPPSCAAPPGICSELHGIWAQCHRLLTLALGTRGTPAAVGSRRWSQKKSQAGPAACWKGCHCTQPVLNPEMETPTSVWSEFNNSESLFFLTSKSPKELHTYCLTCASDDRPNTKAARLSMYSYTVPQSHGWGSVFLSTGSQGLALSPLFSSTHLLSLAVILASSNLDPTLTFLVA